MPQMGGLELLRSLQTENDGDITVVLMTAQGTVEPPSKRSKQGAYDYLAKPIDPQRLKIVLDKIADRNDQRREVLRAAAAAAGARHVRPDDRRQPRDAEDLPGGRAGGADVGVGARQRRVGHRARSSSRRRCTSSARAARSPFVPLNCAAIPDTLLESELFGHEKGAFTGAIARRQGCFELANRGTLFLDEIAEMTPTTQAKLLRVLQERTFRPLGGVREQSVDIRVDRRDQRRAARSRAPGQAARGLFYRLNVFAIRLPPLRDRKDDIPLLAQAFIREFNARNGRSVAGLSDAAMQVLERYDWPGNVRELRNVMERVDDRGQGRARSTSAELPPLANPPRRRARAAAGGLTPGTTVDEAERQLIEVTLQHTGGNKTRAAEMLGISLKTLHNKLNRMKEEGAGMSELTRAHAPEHQDETGRRRHGHRRAGGRAAVSAGTSRRSATSCSARAACAPRASRKTIYQRALRSSPSRCDPQSAPRRPGAAAAERPGPADDPRIGPGVLQERALCRDRRRRAEKSSRTRTHRASASRSNRPRTWPSSSTSAAPIAQLRAIYTRGGKTFEVQLAAAPRHRGLRVDPHRRLDAADPRRVLGSS